MVVAPALVDILRAISLDAVVCHHFSVLSALVSMFCSHEVLMKLLTLLITNSPGVYGEFIKATMKKMLHDTHFTPKVGIS